MGGRARTVRVGWILMAEREQRALRFGKLPQPSTWIFLASFIVLVSFRVTLDSLAQLGFHFRAISTFIEEEAYGSSMYCRALTAGFQGTPRHQREACLVAETEAGPYQSRMTCLGDGSNSNPCLSHSRMACPGDGPHPPLALQHLPAS